MYVHKGRLVIDPQCRIWRILKNKCRLISSISKSGYIYVRVRINGKIYHCLAHRLIWQFLRGDIPPGLEMNHLNGIKHDNRIENLELVTRQENHAHAIRIGLINNRGQNNPSAILTDSEVEEIRSLMATGRYTQNEIATIYEVDQSNISLIMSGKSRSEAV